MSFKNFKKLIAFTLLVVNIMSFSVLAATTEDESQSTEKKIIYLTFDDGPAGKVTSNVLDILKTESVPATFFLIGDQIERQEKLVKRMVDEGHSIGLHSMSHKKGCLYSSDEDFLKEMLDTQELINSAVGFKPTILRFPFGCNNNYYKLSPSLVDLLHKNNLKIYDWNADSGDGANPNSAPSRLIKNSQSHKDRVILLMHCAYMSKNSAKALPGVIKYYKDNGYEFKKIEQDTPEEFHFMKK